MRIQHNIMAMNAYRNYSNNTSALSKNLEKLSSGYKINRAGDDAAGLAISEKMRAQITGLEAAQKNVKDGISLVNTAEGAMQEVQDMLNRMVYLAQESANGTFDNEVDRKALQSEVNQLRDEINRIADSANFNGIKLLDGSLSATGSTSTSNVDLSNLGGGLTSVTVDPVKGKYTMADSLFGTAGSASVAVGDKYTATFTVEDANGGVQKIELNFKIAATSGGSVTRLVAEDDTEYTITDGAPTSAEVAAAIKGELAKNSVMKENFTVNDNGGTMIFTAKTAGTNAMKVTGVESKVTAAATGVETTSKTGMQVSNATDIATDAFESINLSHTAGTKIYNGATDNTSNLAKAQFEINGQKFVFIEKGKVNADTLAAMKAAGVEHYVEVGTAGQIGAADVKAMAEKISMETGLKVEQGTATTNAGTGATTWAATGTGTWIGLKSNTTGKAGGGLTLQIGDSSDDYNQLRVNVKDMHTKAMGIANINIGTQAGAQAAVDVIKNAINYVSEVRGNLGAISNRLDHTANNLSVMRENIQDAESAIRDTDVAEEMMSYTKNNILVQSAQAMLAQANQVPQGVLQLLQ